MTTLQPNRLKSSRTGSTAENRTQTTCQSRDRHSSDGIALAAEPSSYDREYDSLLTLAEAVDR